MTPLDSIEIIKGLLQIMLLAFLTLIIIVLFLLSAYGIFILINKAVCRVIDKRKGKAL